MNIPPLPIQDRPVAPLEFFENTDRYITIYTSDSPIGKSYSKRDTIYKEGLPHSTQAIGRTMHVPDVASLRAILEDVSQFPNKAIILGYIADIPLDTDFHITTESNLKALLKTDEKPRRIYKNGGVYTVARLATLFKRSAWMCFDFDKNAYTPNHLLETDYHDLLVNYNTLLAGVECLEVLSSSSRVLGAGYGENRHIYMLAYASDDIKRFASAMHFRARGTEYGYDIPPKGFGSLIDPSVFSLARIMYEGAPIVHAPLQLRPQEFTHHTGDKPALDTRAYASPPADQMLPRMDMYGRGEQFSVYNYQDLTPDTQIETKEGWMTMQEFVDGDVVRYRCQNPFKEGSTSWSAFLSKENEKGEPIEPRLVSVEYGTYIFNDTPTSLPPVSQSAIPVFANSIPPAPLETQTISPREYAKQNQVSLATIDTKAMLPNIPIDANDALVAKFVAERLFGSRTVLTHGKQMYEWTGYGYAPIIKQHLSHIIIDTVDNAKSFTSSKLASFVSCVESVLFNPQLEYLPPHLIPFANGLFNTKTGEFTDHNQNYFYTDVLDVMYDANTIATEVPQYLRNQSHDPAWQQRALDMMSYIVCEPSNSGHYLFWWDGVSRSGKSTLLKTMLDLCISKVAISINDLAKPKVLSSVARHQVMYDDDTQDIEYQNSSQVVGALKKLPTGVTMNLEVLYEQSLSTIDANVKAVFACNGIPKLHDPHGALFDRSEALIFDTSFRNNPDVHIEERMRSSQELSGLFNLLYQNYTIMRQKANGSRLKITPTAESTRVIEDMLTSNNPVGIAINTITKSNEGATFTMYELVNALRMFVEDKPQYARIVKYGDNTIAKYAKTHIERKEGVVLVDYMSKTYRGLEITYNPFNA